MNAPIVHVANDLAHYTANFGPLRPGDLLLLIDTIESMTSRMRMDLKTIPTVDQRRAVITQVVQVCSFFYHTGGAQKNVKFSQTYNIIIIFSKDHTCMSQCAGAIST